MRVDLGTDVYASDGKKVGTVKRVVLDPDSKQIHQFVVEHGFLNQHDTLVDFAMVTGQDNQGLQLEIDSDQVAELPEFVEERFVQAPDDDLTDAGFMMPNAGGAGMYLYGAPYIGRGYEGGQDSFFDIAPADAPVMSDRSNIQETDVMISEGTDVIAADGEKVGSVDEIVFNSDGQIAGFIVKAGTIFTHDVRVPIEWVANAGSSEIRLNVNSAEAESRSYEVEDSTL